MSRYFEGLNPKQREVAETTEGAVLALAGAGTGKTHTIIARIAGLITNGVRPQNILAVTFTNKAAGELKERLRKTLPKSCKLKDLIASTFHSLAVQIIRRDAPLLGYKNYFSIADQAEQYSIIRKAARSVHGCSKLRPEEMLSQISNLKSKGTSHEEFAMQAIDDWEISLASVYRRYQDQLRLRNTMDFDDLLVKSLQLLQEHAEPREYWQTRFRYITVDEFQDTSNIQNELVKILAGRWKNICVVGDDDQSIYSWRGAVPENILKFHHTWYGAKVIYLEENYRSTNAILKTANVLIKNNTDRHDKELWSNLGQGNPVRLIECEDQQHESAYISGQIRERMQQGMKPSDFAVIVRANALTRTLEGEFAVEKIPYEVIGGQSFFDMKEVRDILSFLSALQNPDDDGALLRIINVPARGIGDKSIERLMEKGRQTGKSIGSILYKAREIEGIPGKAADSCEHFYSLLQKWRMELEENGPNNLVDMIIQDTSYEEEVEHLYDDPLQRTSRMEAAYDVGEGIRNSIGEDGDLGEFLQEATLSWKEKSKDKDKEKADTVKIITIHSAKGLEYRHVFIAGVEEGTLPHRHAEEENRIPEERRLFYVAITRAREQLTITRCLNRLMRGKHTPKEPSRFLGEIPPEMFEKETPSSFNEDERDDILAAIRASMGGED